MRTRRAFKILNPSLKLGVVVTGLVLLAPHIASSAGYPSPQDWRDENIYQIFTDRFADGDPSNNNLESGRGSPYAPAESRGLHGGDFKGIQQKLDYIKALGATAIWINPIPLNIGGDSAYHGYMAQDFYALAPHWGTMADLTNLVAAAHARGIKVILDVVVNHSGDLVYSTDAGYPAFKAPPDGYNMVYRNSNNQHAPPFLTNSIVPTLSSLFHTNGAPGDVVLGEMFGDDFRTETAYVRTNMMNIYTNWVGRADFDGFRLDTVPLVEMGFWQYWCPQLHQFGSSIGKSNFFMFGEVWDSDAACGSFTGTMGGGPFKLDSTVDYPLYYAINAVLAQANGPTSQIEDHYNAIPAYYDTNAWYRLVTFLDNHDNARFLSPGKANNDTNRLVVALEFLYTSRGIPCLYYGTEQAFNGGYDPYDREDMFAGQFEQGPSLGDNFGETHPLFQLIAKLNNFRRLYPSLRRGGHNNLWSDASGPGLFAYSRVLSNEEAIVVFNAANSTLTLTNCPTTYPAGTVLVNLLNTNESIIVAGASTNITPLIDVPSLTAKIFISASLLKPLDPVVIGQSPSHATTICLPTTPVVLQFSKPMDTTSVQAAFSTTPATTGTFTWSTNRTTMTFTPSVAGWSTSTNFVRLATNATDSVSGKTLYAPFETYFVVAGQPWVVSTSSSGGGTATGGGTYCASLVTVTAVPDSCYGFLNWTENGVVVSSAASYSFNADRNRTLVANFLPGRAVVAEAADNASDSAYALGFGNGSNGGIGFRPWVLSKTFSSGNCNGFFVGSSTAVSPHALPGINVNGKSWGLYANDVYCSGEGIAAAFRALDIGPLQTGGQVMLDMANGYNDWWGWVGLALRTGNATNSPEDFLTGYRLVFDLEVGSANYSVWDAAGWRDSGIPVTYQGLRLIFTLGTNDSYSLRVVTLGNGVTNLITGTLAGSSGSTLDSLALFNYNNGPDSARDVFFNSLLVMNLAPPTYTISANIGSAPSGGGSGSVTVYAANICNWTATNNVPWMSITSGSSGAGTGTVTYSVAASTNMSSRIGTLTIAGQTYTVTQAGMDSIGDGIPDSWRAQYFPNVDPTGTTTNNLSCASCDASGTGQNNLFKYVAGLDPTNSASVFELQITVVTNQPTQKSLLFKPMATGRTYTPEFSTDLTLGGWSPLAGHTGPVTNGNQVTITDTNAIEPQKFYRIKIGYP